MAYTGRKFWILKHSSLSKTQREDSTPLLFYPGIKRHLGNLPIGKLQGGEGLPVSSQAMEINSTMLFLPTLPPGINASFYVKRQAISFYSRSTAWESHNQISVNSKLGFQLWDDDKTLSDAGSVRLSSSMKIPLSGYSQTFQGAYTHLELDKGHKAWECLSLQNSSHVASLSLKPRE